MEFDNRRSGSSAESRNCDFIKKCGGLPTRRYNGRKPPHLGPYCRAKICHAVGKPVESSWLRVECRNCLSHTCETQPSITISEFPLLIFAPSASLRLFRTMLLNNEGARRLQ